ncbi:hypothetical protein STCU_09583 [Strigomonas culicis]|uniref:Uncharacterized protein n=1 Tax=Strigomonas culicis TaxID=28005 RepID=S9TRG2_9TRYP|nr:hypothetical protein STCU_09583 [Strigomonas culicis]|eukprot:EPY19189.1 hypothetical protein STCU_09583 [Strigomonas culicis]
MSEDSFEHIAEENRKLMSMLGIEPNEQTVEASLLQMMSSLGEFATLSYRNKKSISPFEKEEVEILIGKLTISLSMLAECFEISPGRAALRCIEDSKPEASMAPQSQAPQQMQQRPSPEPIKSPSREPSPPSHPEPVVLSPNSKSNFFTYVDQLNEYSKNNFDKVGLKWVAPNSEGRLEELLPSGAARTVTYDEFPEYLRRIQQYRNAIDSSRRMPQMQEEPRIITHTVNYDPEKEAQMFSPSHFSGGLFSPMAKPSDIMMTDVKPPSAFLSKSVPQSPQQQQQQKQRQPAPQNEKRTALDDILFKVKLLKQGNVRVDEIPLLNLTFSVPDKMGNIVNLVENGDKKRVTEANVFQFMNLMDTFLAQSNVSNPLRRVEVSERSAATEYNNFSPSHFNYGLSAPFEKKSAFYVDYNDSNTLPPCCASLVRAAAPSTWRPAGGARYRHSRRSSLR